MTDEEYLNHPLVKILDEIIIETNGSFGKNILMNPKYDNLCVDFIDKVNTDNWESFINEYIVYNERCGDILDRWVKCFYDNNKNNFILRINGILIEDECEINYVELLNESDELLYEYVLIMAGIDYIRKQQHIEDIDRVYYTLLSYFYSDSDKIFFDESLNYDKYLKELTIDDVLQWCKYYFTKFSKYKLLLDSWIITDFSIILNRFIIVYNYKNNSIYRKILLNAIGLLYIKFNS